MATPILTVLVGSQKHPAYDGKLKAHLLEFGIEVNWSWYTDSNTRDMKSTLKKADLVLVATDQCSHPLDKKVKAAAGRAKTRFLRIPHHWATASRLLEEAGYVRAEEAPENGEQSLHTTDEGASDMDRMEKVYNRLKEATRLVLPIVALHPTISVKALGEGPMATYEWKDQKLRNAIYDSRRVLGLVCERAGKGSPMEVENLVDWNGMRALLERYGYAVKIPKAAMRALGDGEGAAGKALPGHPFPPAFEPYVGGDEYPENDENAVVMDNEPPVVPDLRVVPEPEPEPEPKEAPMLPTTRPPEPVASEDEPLAISQSLPGPVREWVEGLLHEMRANGVTEIRIAVPGGKTGTATVSWERIEMVRTKGEEML